MSFRVKDLKDSRFLAKEDVEPDVLVTIKSYEKVNVALESMAPEMKWTVRFLELPKPLVLNSTNGQLLEAITGSDNSDDWIGKKVVLYNDKTVSFAGRITGGIRVRAIKTQQIQNPVGGEPNPDWVGDNPPSPTDDEIPY